WRREDSIEHLLRRAPGLSLRARLAVHRHLHAVDLVVDPVVHWLHVPPPGAIYCDGGIRPRFARLAGSSGSTVYECWWTALAAGHRGCGFRVVHRSGLVCQRLTCRASLSLTGLRGTVSRSARTFIYVLVSSAVSILRFPFRV